MENIPCFTGLADTSRHAAIIISLLREFSKQQSHLPHRRIIPSAEAGQPLKFEMSHTLETGLVATDLPTVLSHWHRWNFLLTIPLRKSSLGQSNVPMADEGPESQCLIF